MTAGIFALFTALAALIVEVLLGNLGIPLPLSIFIILYFAATTSWRRAAFLALVCGLILDALYSRNAAFSSAYLLLILVAARPAQPKWLRDETLLSATVSGAAAGLIQGLYMLILKLVFPALPISVWGILSFTPMVIFGGALLCPIFFWSLDRIAKRIEQPIYFAAPAVSAVARPRPRRVTRYGGGKA